MSRAQRAQRDTSRNVCSKNRRWTSITSPHAPAFFSLASDTVTAGSPKRQRKSRCSEEKNHPSKCSWKTKAWGFDAIQKQLPHGSCLMTRTGLATMTPLLHSKPACPSIRKGRSWDDMSSKFYWSKSSCAVLYHTNDLGQNNMRRNALLLVECATLLWGVFKEKILYKLIQSSASVKLLRVPRI